MYNFTTYCVLFPENNETNVLSLKQKCDAIGISHKENDTRKTLRYSTESSEEAGFINEKEVKLWINQQGASSFYDDEKSLEYKNWERLLFSEDDDNRILAITLLNAKYRPKPKFFSLLLALGLFHENEKIKETAEYILLPYIEKSRWDLMKLDAIVGAVPFIVEYLNNTKDPLNNFFDINYFLLWRRLLTKQFKKTSLKMSTKNFDFIYKSKEFKQDFSEITNISLRLENGDSISYLIKLLDRCPKVDSIHIYSDKVYQLTADELSYLNRTSLIVKNLELPEVQYDSPVLEKVKFLEWIYYKEINYSDYFFPNAIYKLDLLGTTVQRMDISSTAPYIKELILCLTEKSTLPDCIFDCKSLSTLHVHDSKIEKVSSKFKNLEKLKMLCLKGSEFLEFPVEFMLTPNFDFLYHLSPPKNGDYRFDQYEKFGDLNRIDWENKEITEFPYALCVLDNLKSMNFESSKISEIDNRIAKFKSLEILSFGDNQFERFPTSIFNMPNMKSINFEQNLISKLSFDFFVKANKRNIIIDLRNNPIKSLPEISIDFKKENRIKNSGKIIFTPGSIPRQTIAKYQSVFGEEFIVG
ncbi:MAG: leucine-rich repeat domain-containing protein [Saprospiraceae bacterium]